jgi:hypothetical protein
MVFSIAGSTLLAPAMLDSTIIDGDPFPEVLHDGYTALQH